jgi:hypothetical protein
MRVLLALLFCDGILLYAVTDRARSRLRRFHPDLFHALGKPALEDSNLTFKYWAFARFLWWDHMKVTDPALRRLCTIYCLGALTAIMLIVILWVNGIN